MLLCWAKQVFFFSPSKYSKVAELPLQWASRWHTEYDLDVVWTLWTLTGCLIKHVCVYGNYNFCFINSISMYVSFVSALILHLILLKNSNWMNNVAKINPVPSESFKCRAKLGFFFLISSKSDKIAIKKLLLSAWKSLLRVT